MKRYIKLCFASAALCFFCGCFGPVLNMGDRIIPIKNHNGIPVVSARNPMFKEIHYSTFGFDWNEKDGFLIPRNANNVNYAFWWSTLSQAPKLYSVVFTAAKQRHYLKNTDLKQLQTYIADSYREVPVSKIKRTTFKTELSSFKGIPAVYVYLETFEEGRELYLREESIFFFDPLAPDTLIYQVRWSERGKKSEWRSTKAEIQGRRFFECFKLLPVKK